MVGRAQRGHGLQPPGRPGDRRAQPAHRRPRAAAGRAVARREVWAFVLLSAARAGAGRGHARTRCAWRSRRSRWPSSSATPTPSASRRSRTSSSGLALAIAPVGAWLAVRGTLRAGRRSCSGWPCSAGWPASTPSTPARTWSSTGASGLHSLPARLGVARRAAGRARASTWPRSVAAGRRSTRWCRCTRSTSRAWPRSRGAARLRALAGARGRPVARGRRVLHRERLDQRRATSPSRWPPGGSREPRAMIPRCRPTPRRRPARPRRRPCARCSTASRRATTC